jgi:hypothetical protein
MGRSHSDVKVGPPARPKRKTKVRRAEVEALERKKEISNA